MLKLEQSLSKYASLYDKGILEGDSCSQAKKMIADAGARIGSVNVLMLESCLHLGLSTCNTVIIASQLAKISGGEIDEQAVNVALLSKACEMVG